MKIFEASLYSNEAVVSRVKILENSRWVDQFHVLEANKNFAYMDKTCSFEYDDSRVVYHKIDGARFFKKPGYSIRREFPFFGFKHRKWVNEEISRNLSSSYIKPDDDDIIILSDMDEIVDSRFSGEIIEEVRRRGIITIKMRYSFFYFNLFWDNHGGPPDWSYRVFIVLGSVFKSMKMTHDQLRKKGERGQLIDQIYCLPFFAGFHHSWLGDVDAVLKKFEGYSHSPLEYNSRLINPMTGLLDREYITHCLANNKSFLSEGESLVLRDDILLDSVELMRPVYPSLFYSST